MKKEDKEDLAIAFFCALLFFALIILMLPGCAKEPPKKDGPPAAPAEQFVAVEDRAAAMTSPAGWIACIEADGSPGCLGDSLLFTGLALGAADCEHGEIYLTALSEMIHANAGILERHPTIPGASLDGALGFLWGMARRYENCPGSRDAVAEAVRSYAEHGAGSLEPYFTVVLRQVLADVGDGDSPSEHDRGMLGSQIAGWALATVTTRSAAYRIHLGYLGLSLVDAPKGRGSYCAAVEQAKMPLIEDFCGRPGLGAWLATFGYDVVEYAFQRGAWETEANPGRHYAGVDFLMGYRQAYGWSNESSLADMPRSLLVNTRDGL